MKSWLKWFRTLQAQLILWTILPATLAIIALAFTGIYAHQSEMQRFVSERNALVVELVAAQIEDGLARGIISPDGEMLSQWLPEQSTRISGSLFILDDQGEVLAYTRDTYPHPSTRQYLRTNAGVVQSTNSQLVSPEEDPLLLNLAYIHGTLWMVVLQEPVADLIGQILRFSNLGPVAALIATVFSVFILSFGWRTIIRPLQHLAHATEQVSWGNHKAIEQPMKGVAEIQGLHDALREMIHRIEGYETSIRDYLDAMTEGQESERTRLARELHDGPVQTLITLGQRAEMAQRYVNRGNLPQAVETIEELRTREVEIVDELRRIIRDLRPIYLEDLGLVAALGMLVRTANAQHSTEVSLEHAVEFPRWDANVELAVYRIAQEATHNALHHASAKHIMISLFSFANGLTLTVTDDGTGFIPPKSLDRYTREGHFGLVGIQERVRQLGGTLNIVSQPGLGTTLSVSIPDMGRVEEATVIR